jgi:aldose 1-epimerase
VLGLNSLADYIAHSPHFGATAGRFANRIANGRFTLDGHVYQLPLNEKGRATLHGGPTGFGKRPWHLEGHDAASVALTLRSADGDNGFPGALEARCVYMLVAPATLRIEMSATTDAPTIVNLAHHSYFNLDGSPDARDHELTINADFYTPLDEDLIPTGEIRSVAGTPYDFRRPRPVRQPGAPAYDLSFVLPFADAATGLVHAATLRSPRGDLSMQVWTSEPALQFYDAAKLNCPVPGLGGARYGPFAGLCFEAQRFPDSPNRRHFTSAVLRPGERYRQITEYRFS